MAFYHVHYHGETVQKLKEKFNGHISGFRNSEKHGNCRILCEDFNVGLCKGGTYKFKSYKTLRALSLGGPK